jgi:hypothetical protein
MELNIPSMWSSWIKNKMAGWMWMGAIGIALLLAIYLWIVLMVVAPKESKVNPTAQMSVLVAPTATPTSIATTLQPGDASGISVGTYVQIKGTEGSGLRIRSAPGMNSTLNFLGMDSEVFRVKDGPKEVDGHTWWLLEAPYDEKRNGWAASDFLSIVATP